MEAGDKVWVAKYVLTEGLKEATVLKACAGYLYIEGRPHGLLRPGRDVFASREKALARADELIGRRLKSLNRSVQSVEKLRDQLGLNKA
jgi:hypothetical protein